MTILMEPCHVLNCNGSNFTAGILERILEMLHQHGEVRIVNLAPKSVSLEVVENYLQKAKQAK